MRRAMLYGLGILLGMFAGTAVLVSLPGCASAGQIHKRAAAMPLTDRDSLDCNAPGLPRTGPGSVMSWIYRMNGSFIQYDSVGAVAAGQKVSFPDVWLPSGRYYEDFAARDSGGVSCAVRRWFTIRGVPKTPTPDPLAPGEQ